MDDGWDGVNPAGARVGRLDVDAKSLLRRRALLVLALERGWLEGTAKGPDLEFWGWGARLKMAEGKAERDGIGNERGVGTSMARAPFRPLHCTIEHPTILSIHHWRTIPNTQ